MHPLIGTWIANIEKSTRHENHKFASAKMHFAVDNDELRISYEGVNASGRPEKSEQVLSVDGQPHHHPLAPGIVVTSSVGPRGLDSTALREGAWWGTVRTMSLRMAIRRPPRSQASTEAGNRSNR